MYLPNGNFASLRERGMAGGNNSTNGRISLVEADPDLLRGFDPSAAEAIRRAANVHVMELDTGPWRRTSKPPTPIYGLFVLEGVLSRGVVIQGRRSAELLGPGDILRPSASDDMDSSVDFDVAWEMLEATRLALLDIEFANAIAPWPELTGAVMDRIMRRAHALAFHLAVSHLKLVETRLLVILWYYADRWGRVTPTGVLLPVRMTHSLLARVVGARRPSVSTALGKLQERGFVERTDNGHWLLLGPPPRELDELAPSTAAD
jgi:CRP/FNR family transcriptional regulator, cyclic AMP receptor protein